MSSPSESRVTDPESEPKLCYLCGKPLTPPTNRDHIPALQFFAPSIRQRYNLARLLTAEVHQQCNSTYKSDEEYLVYALLGFMRGSEAGDELYKHILAKYRRGEAVGLIKKVLAEFEPRPGGLVLPGNQVLKRFDGGRIRRVAWKVVRGLYFHRTGKVLPENLTVAVTLTTPDERPPGHFISFRDLPDNDELGHYPGVFAYRFQVFPEVQNAQYWALLLWDRVILTVAFHDPACTCADCQAKRTS